MHSKMDTNGNPIVLDDKQKKILQAFRETFKDAKLPHSSDAYLLRWLVARNFDPVQAEKMLRTSLDWRKVNQVDDIKTTWTPPEVMVKYFPLGTVGHDKFGCPILINAYGRCDMRGIVQSVSKKDYLRYIVYEAEKTEKDMQRMGEKTGRGLTKQIMIVDMDQMSMRSISDKRVMELGMDAIKMSEAHYPEALRRVFVINAPRLFAVVFNMVKNLLHEGTVNKFRVFGTDSETWKAALLEEIDADQLPVHYGGTMTDPDGNPMCLTKVVAGGEVPTSYYVVNQKLQPSENMECVTISNGAKKRIEVQVPVANSLLRWQFMTEEADVGFHIYYMDGKDKVDVIPLDRVPSHMVMEEGMVLCTRAEPHYVEFDNTYSYLRSKKVWFTVIVDPPIISPTSGDVQHEVEKAFKQCYGSKQMVQVRW